MSSIKIKTLECPKCGKEASTGLWNMQTLIEVKKQRIPVIKFVKIQEGMYKKEYSYICPKCKKEVNSDEFWE